MFFSEPHQKKDSIASSLFLSLLSDLLNYKAKDCLTGLHRIKTALSIKLHSTTSLYFGLA